MTPTRTLPELLRQLADDLDTAASRLEDAGDVVFAAELADVARLARERSGITYERESA